MSVASTTHAAFDPVAPQYDQQTNPMLGLEERYMAGLLPDVRGLDVLDVGCGTGRWLKYLSKFGPRSLTGVDPSECMLAIAREKLGTSARLLPATAESLPLLDASSDIILLSFVLSYCDHLDEVVHELARVARPHATIFVSDVHPESEEKFQWKRSFASDAGTVAMAHARHRREALKKCFRRSGFEVAVRLDLPFGSEEWCAIEKAGKASAMEPAREEPAIYIAQFVATRSTSRDAVALTSAQVAFGPSTSARADLVLAKGKVAAVGTAQERASNPVDLDGCLVLPGLINAHDHLEFGLYPKLGRGPYENSLLWARDIHTRERDVIQLHERVPKDVRLYFGGLRNLLSGVTTVCQHNPYALVFRNPDFPVRVVENVGWAHSLAFDREGILARDGDQDRPFVIHAAEGTDAAARREIAELDAMGALDRRSVLVHALACSAQDVELINRRGASVIVCPSSNAFLYGATLAADSVYCLSRAALGTDSPMTACGDLLEEIRFAQNTLESSASDLYGMCTQSASQILQLRLGEGRIVIGGCADLLIVLDKGSSPADTLCSLTLEDFELIVVGGRICLASASGLKRVPANLRGHLQALLVDDCEVWVDAPLAWMFEQARAVLGREITISGKRVDYVG